MAMLNFNSWSSLKEVWLGDCYPKHFYDHLDSKVKDCFHEITEITQQDLQIIQNKLEELGVVVRRPKYDQVNHYINDGQLEKPHITPRDFYFCHDNNLYFNDNFNQGRPWFDTVSYYKQNNTVNIQNRFLVGLQINGSNVVRVGRDVYFDLAYDDMPKPQQIQLFRDNVLQYFKNHRCHLLWNGGHVDGCFAILKPGLILASNYFEDYEKTFPGWEVIHLNKTEFQRTKQKPTGFHAAKNWYVPNDKKNNSFNDHIIKYALDWVGNYKETYFDINCLVVDEQNILMLGENEALYKVLNQKGINVHMVPFRARTFWDGGLHCLTVDILRDSTLADYFHFKDNLIIY
jgi:hypothetical protein